MNVGKWSASHKNLSFLGKKPLFAHCPLHRNWVGTCVRLDVAKMRNCQESDHSYKFHSPSFQLLSCVKKLRVTASEGGTGAND